jgi:hypothetical protein
MTMYCSDNAHPALRVSFVRAIISSAGRLRFRAPRLSRTWVIALAQAGLLLLACDQWALGQGSNPGTDENVTQIAIDSTGRIYFSGPYISLVGSSNVNRVACWWSAGSVSDLDHGVLGGNGVFALAASGTNLYVGGSFYWAGSTPVNNIARWSGDYWSALGSGAYGNVSALAAAGTNLYAGGDFLTAGGATVHSVAVWNGTYWQGLGTGIGGLWPYVNRLAVSGDTVYAGGTFTNAGGSYASHVAKWDGSAWSGLGSGLVSGPNGDPTVSALAAAGSYLYVGGCFTNAGGVPANYIARWNGTSWSALGAGMNNNVYALAISGGTVYAGGCFTNAGGSPANYIAKWDGTRWSALGTGMDGWVYALAVSGNILYAGGAFTNAGGTPAYHLAKWDGSRWAPVIMLPPRILEQPASQLAVAGTNVTLTVAADGTRTLFFQWLKNNAAITAATNATLTLTGVTVSSSGNYSVTVRNTAGSVTSSNAVLTVYVITNQLALSANGAGTFNPNYSNAWLQAGHSYTITATPGNGFAFSNWTGGSSLPLAWLTNAATLQFTMVSNLMLQANFVDTSQPTLGITNLAAGQRVTNAVFTVRGTASDNWQVSNVVCQINNSGWTNAAGTTNWSIPFTLIPGTNRFAAYAMDTTGNHSATTNSVSFQFVVTNQLGVQASGLGTISPNYSNAWLEIGRNYSMTATPGSGFIVTNWTISTNWLGGMQTNNATVQFMMSSNLTLQVTFADVTKPALTITTPVSGQRMTNALANVIGTASDNWKVAGVWYQLNSNVWNLVTTTNNYTNWTKTVTLLAGTNTIKAYAQDLGGNFSTTATLSIISSNTFKLQLTFDNQQPLKANGLTFNLELSTGLNGHVQVSSNLIDWATLTNFTGTNATLNFRDAGATNFDRRFYRAVIP